MSLYRSFQFNLFAQKCNFKDNRLVLYGVADKVVIYEVRTAEKRPNVPYVSSTFPLMELVSQWNEIYPQKAPNSYLNGFDGDKRKLLTSALDNPILKGKQLSFTYNKDVFVGNKEISPDIGEWNSSGDLSSISLTIDSYVQNSPNVNKSTLSEQFNLYSKRCSFQDDTIIFENVVDLMIRFETESPGHNRSTPYTSLADKVTSLINNWNQLFEGNNPNCFINGFIGNTRYLLALTLKNPVFVNDTLIFGYELDKFEGSLSINKSIQQWNRKGILDKVSLLVDSVSSIGYDLYLNNISFPTCDKIFSMTTPDGQVGYIQVFSTNVSGKIFYNLYFYKQSDTTKLPLNLTTPPPAFDPNGQGLYSAHYRFYTQSGQFVVISPEWSARLGYNTPIGDTSTQFTAQLPSNTVFALADPCSGASISEYTGVSSN